MNREKLKSIFDALRNDPQHHLGLGDIRLTIAQQDAILDLFPFKDKVLPPAEGAEEILEDIAMRIDASGVGNNRDAIKRFYRDKLNTLATLHAQRIAEKMVEWVSVKDKLPEERENVLCYNGYRISSHNWCKYTDQDDDWFKKTFTHWCKLPKIP